MLSHTPVQPAQLARNEARGHEPSTGLRGTGARRSLPRIRSALQPGPNPLRRHGRLRDSLSSMLRRYVPDRIIVRWLISRCGVVGRHVPAHAKGCGTSRGVSLVPTLFSEARYGLYHRVASRAHEVANIRSSSAVKLRRNRSSPEPGKSAISPSQECGEHARHVPLSPVNLAAFLV